MVPEDVKAQVIDAVRYVGTATIPLQTYVGESHGMIFPLLAPIAGGVAARGGADVLVLSSPVEFTVEGSVARAHLKLREGNQIGFALEHSASWEPALEPWSQEMIRDRLVDTVTGGRCPARSWLVWYPLGRASRRTI